MSMGAEPRVFWAPNPGPQTKFLKSSAYEVLYGGAAGGGKSESLLVGSLRHVGDPARTGCGCRPESHRGYKALLLRRTYPELERSIIARSLELFPQVGGHWNDQKKVWSFGGGERIYFAHLEYDHSVHQHQSAEYQYIGFDELTSFSEKQYTYMLSRARSSGGIPVQIRGATNPGGIGHAWVYKRWQPWLNRKHSIQAGPGQRLHYVVNDDGEKYVPVGTPRALSRVFIPAKLLDNPALLLNDPSYADRLSGLDPVTRAQLRDGDWLAAPGKGEYFKRAWFKLQRAAPKDGIFARVRRWDFAATTRDEHRDPDWTVGVKMFRMVDGLYVVENVVRFRGTPHEVDATLMLTARLDGPLVRVKIPQDPGSAGKHVAALQVTALAGYWATAERETGDKVSRAGPYSAQVQAGNVTLIEGDWNEEFIREHEAFPEGNHDDQVDAAAGAFNELTPEGYDLRKLVAAK